MVVPLFTDKQSNKTPVAKKDKDKFKPQPESFLANCATAKCNQLQVKLATCRNAHDSVLSSSDVVDVGKKVCAYQQKGEYSSLVCSGVQRTGSNTCMHLALGCECSGGVATAVCVCSSPQRSATFQIRLCLKWRFTLK